MNQEEDVHWGERVRRARETLKFSREQVAADLGCSPTHIYRLERAPLRPPRSKLVEPLEVRLGLSAGPRERQLHPEHWGRQIHRAYQEEGFTRTAFAVEVGCSISELQRLERLSERPATSRYVGQIERLLSLGAHSPVADLEVARALTRATKLQLARALARILEREEAEESARRDELRRAAQQVPGFTGSDDLLRGTGEPGDPESREADPQVEGEGGTDGTPPTGAVES